MNSIWRNLRSTLTHALRDTPLEVILVLGCAVLASTAVESALPFDSDIAFRIMLVAVLMFLTSFAASALHVLKVFDSRTRWTVSGAGIAGLSVYGIWVLDPHIGTEMWRWSFLALAATMGVTLVPVAARLGDAASPSERFFRYNVRLLARVIVAYGYAFLLFVGLAIGLVAISELFDLALRESFFHLFVWVVLALGSLLAVGSLDDIRHVGQPLDSDTLMWNGRLGTYLFMPLVLLYLGIMYAYLAKVVTTGELPSNILSPLALGAGILGYFGTFVLFPQSRRATDGPLSKLLRAFPVAFLPIIPVGVWAVWERIAQYGWTEFRYARMAAFLCLAAFSVYAGVSWLRKKDFSLVAAPAILAAVSLLAAVGPWGASNVSMVSQQARFAEAKASGTPAQHSNYPRYGTETSSAQEIAEYLLETHGPMSMSPFVDQPLSGSTVSEQLVELNLAPTRSSERFEAYSALDQPHHFPRAGTATQFGMYGEPIETDGFKLSLEGSTIVVDYGGRVSTGIIRLEDLKFLPPGELTPEAREVPLFDGVEMVGYLSLEQITVRYYNEVPSLTQVSGMAMIYD